MHRENLTPIENSLLKDYSLDKVSSFFFAPINSAKVERAFSIYINILTDRRRSFAFENLRMVFVVHCFHSLESSADDLEN